MKLQDLWQKFTDHYNKDFIFGYADRELYYRFSVMDKRSGRARFANMGLSESMDTYKKTWYRLIKEFSNV